MDKPPVNKAVVDKASVDKGKNKRGCGRGGVCHRVALNDGQRLVDAYETVDNYLSFARRIGVNYNTARSITWLWLRNGRVVTGLASSLSSLWPAGTRTSGTVLK